MLYNIEYIFAQRLSLISLFLFQIYRTFVAEKYAIRSLHLYDMILVIYGNLG